MSEEITGESIILRSDESEEFLSIWSALRARKCDKFKISKSRCISYGYSYYGNTRKTCLICENIFFTGTYKCHCTLEAIE